MAAQMQSSKTTGPGAAAVVAAGIGTFTIGLMTSLAEASASLSNSLNWYKPSGPLSERSASLSWRGYWRGSSCIRRGRTRTSGVPSAGDSP